MSDRNAYMRDYYARNRERLIEYRREWRAKNRDKMRAQPCRQKDKTAEYQKRYRAANAEKLKKIRANWRRKNKDRIAEYNRAYKKRGRNGYKVERDG